MFACHSASPASRAIVARISRFFQLSRAPSFAMLIRLIRPCATSTFRGLAVPPLYGSRASGPLPAHSSGSIMFCRTTVDGSSSDALVVKTSSTTEWIPAGGRRVFTCAVMSSASASAMIPARWAV